MPSRTNRCFCKFFWGGFFARSTSPILSKSRPFSSAISLLQKRDSRLKCLFQLTFGPHKKKSVCWCCSLYCVYVVLAHVLRVPVDIMETQPRKPSRNNRNKQKTQETKQKQAENPGKPRKTQEAKQKKTLQFD